jgi:hypothetical protein
VHVESRFPERLQLAAFAADEIGMIASAAKTMTFIVSSSYEAHQSSHEVGWDDIGL